MVYLPPNKDACFSRAKDHKRRECAGTVREGELVYVCSYTKDTWLDAVVVSLEGSSVLVHYEVGGKLHRKKLHIHSDDLSIPAALTSLAPCPEQSEYDPGRGIKGQALKRAETRESADGDDPMIAEALRKLRRDEEIRARNRTNCLLQDFHNVLTEEDKHWYNVHVWY
eukprot:gnl/TRDRNA2_/TRDRNA2_126810_c0_seq2.p2 gnl/TRDRNA2_/TRDRNA2_126810_c0~~gnl/TRDRNA2_/TRDRNA2_126810_c0_seq2.p2  ORF type:complete len:168 (-),score=23.98 gnl/TRDRNA2_/TRDRNA2_126810_c0_seq2:145-648(-)